MSRTLNSTVMPSVDRIDKLIDKPCGFDTLIEDSPLSVRAMNALRTAGYRSLVQCGDLKEADFLKIRNVGVKTAKEIVSLIETIRLREAREAENGRFAGQEWQSQAISPEQDQQTLLLSLPITLLPLSVRARGVLTELKIACLLDLASRTPQELLNQRNCGRKTLSEIQSLLKEVGLAFGTTFPVDVRMAVKARRKPGEVEAILAEVREKLPDISGKLVEIRAKAIPPSRTEFYKRCFQEYPIQRAAFFIYLNRTCWNVLYRVNRQGRFNVPVGQLDRLEKLFDPSELIIASHILKRAKIQCCDFERAVQDANPGDLVYFDPPYITTHLRNGFVKYNSRLFQQSDELRLATVAQRLIRAGVSVMISNAAHPLIKQQYDGPFYKRELLRPSLIAADPSKRSRFTELLITSFPIEA